MFFTNFSDYRLCLSREVVDRSQLGRFGIPYSALTNEERRWLETVSYVDFIQYCFSDYNSVYRRHLFMCEDDIVVDLLDAFIFRPDNRFLEGPMGQKVVAYAWGKHGLDLYDIFDCREKYGVPLTMATFSGLGYPVNSDEFLATKFSVISPNVQVRDVLHTNDDVEDLPFQARSPTCTPPRNQPRCISPCYNPVSPIPCEMETDAADSTESSQTLALPEADACNTVSFEATSQICVFSQQVETVTIQPTSSTGGRLVPAYQLKRLMQSVATYEEQAIIKLINLASIGKNSEESAMQLDEFCKQRAPDIEVPKAMRGKTLNDVVNSYYRLARLRETQMRATRSSRRLQQAEPHSSGASPEVVNGLKRLRVSSDVALDPG